MGRPRGLRGQDQRLVVLGVERGRSTRTPLPCRTTQVSRSLVPVLLRADRRYHLRRRPGPLGVPLLLATYVLLGVALVAYVVAMLALAFAAVSVHTARLVLGPPVGALRRVARSA